MSDPQLRCLLCDLILAEEGRTDSPTETCKQCGRKVLAGQTVGEAVELQPLNPPPKPKPLDLDIDLLPEAAVVPPTPAVPPPATPPADDIPSVPVLSKARRVEDDVPTVPTVQPRGKITTSPADVPYAARRTDPPPARPAPASTPPAPARPASKPGPNFPARKVSIPDPSRVPDAQPRPKVLQAFAILGCMTLLGVIAVTIIIACIVIGLMKAANKAEAPRPATPVVEHRG